jgi:hypothetical protein
MLVNISLNLHVKPKIIISIDKIRPQHVKSPAYGANHNPLHYMFYLFTWNITFQFHVHKICKYKHPKNAEEKQNKRIQYSFPQKPETHIIQPIKRISYRIDMNQ